MSNIKVQGNVSGTGSLTIAAPNTNTDRTLTLPDESGTVLTSASPVIAQAGVPAFSAHQTTAVSQTLTNTVDTKIIFNNVRFDTTSAYSTSTNRFTPQVAGYYLITAIVGYVANTLGARKSSIRVNGNEIYTVLNAVPNTSDWVSVCSTGVVYLNGSTDYVDVYGQQNTGGNLNTIPYGGWTNFSGVLVRAA